MMNGMQTIQDFEHNPFPTFEPPLTEKEILWELKAIYYLNQQAIQDSEKRITASLQKLRATVLGTSCLQFLIVVVAFFITK